MRLDYVASFIVNVLTTILPLLYPRRYDYQISRAHFCNRSGRHLPCTGSIAHPGRITRCVAFTGKTSHAQKSRSNSLTGRERHRLQPPSRRRLRPRRNALARKRRLRQQRVLLQVPPHRRRRRRRRLLTFLNRRVQSARRLPQRLPPQPLLPPLRQRAADMGWYGLTPSHTFITMKARVFMARPRRAST